MKKKLLLMLLAVGLTAGAAQANMLANPGFEEGVFAPNNVPDSWSMVWNLYPAGWTWYSTGGVGGGKHIQLGFTFSSPTYVSPVFLGQYVSVAPGGEYAFSVWVKSPSPGRVAYPRGRYSWFDSGSVKISEGWMFPDIDAGDTWAEADFGTYIAPAGAVTVAYWLVGYVSWHILDTGVLYDDASMTNVSGMMTTTPDVVGLAQAAAEAAIVAAGLIVGTVDTEYSDTVPFGDVISQSPTAGTRVVLDSQVDLVVSDGPALDVDAGIDMITWSDQPVQLDPNVVCNGPGLLTCHWSADPDNGVEFSDPNVKAPTVTITKATENPSVIMLTLAVNLQGWTEPDVEDNMTIDVYDDPCLAAIAALGSDYDFDENCIRNLEDFSVISATWQAGSDLEDLAAMASKWLVDYTLLAPVPKP